MPIRFSDIGCISRFGRIEITDMLAFASGPYARNPSTLFAADTLIPARVVAPFLRIASVPKPIGFTQISEPII